MIAAVIIATIISARTAPIASEKGEPICGMGGEQDDGPETAVFLNGSFSGRP